MAKLLVPLFVALTLTGCAVGPDYQRPAFALPAQYARQPGAVDPTTAGNVQPDAGDHEFWRGFGDPQLSALVEQALAANRDLRVALAHYDSADALLRESKFDRYPTVTANAQGGRQRVSDDQSFGYPRSARTYSAGIDASWELDLFGRVRRSVEAQRADSAASAADLAALQVAIASETASTYVQLRGLQERLRVAQANADNQRDTLRLVDARLAAGRGTEFDSARARALFETTASRVPALQAQIAVAEHRLAVLTGQAPEALTGQLDSAKPLPTLPVRIDPGTPGELLRRRPDIAAAEQRLHAATARIGVTTADLFPRLSLSGLLGTQAFHADALFKSGSETNSALLGIDWSFLDVGRVRARIAASRADAAGQLAQYQQTVLLALEDTENALVRDARTRSEDEQLEHAARDSEQAAQLARLRYQAGEIDLYEVLDAERSLLSAQDTFADSHTRSVTAVIALYQALAGGWPQRMPSRDTVALVTSTTASTASDGNVHD